MRSSLLSATLAVIAGVSAYPQEIPNTKPSIPSLPVNVFEATQDIVTPVPLDIAVALFRKINETQEGEPELLPTLPPLGGLLKTRATCSSVRTRTEWDSYSNSDRQAFIDGIKCLMSRSPGGQFKQSKSRYEDLVALHQTLTPNVHGSAKFLLWHRYYVWVFEDMLRSECGFNRAMPWFDETKYAGRFAQSSIFSSQWFGSVNIGGRCVTDGQFANLAINVGPGQNTNQLHCLARNNDDSKTANCNQAYVDQCNNWGDFAGMAQCSEGGPHAWGHNGVGSVMQDVWASPSDPVFWLHHGFVDRTFRIWQNKNANRKSTINGNDKQGRPLTLDTSINVYDLRPNVRVRDILDTTGQTLCYKYNY